MEVGLDGKRNWMEGGIGLKEGINERRDLKG